MPQQQLRDNRSTIVGNGEAPAPADLRRDIPASADAVVEVEGAAEQRPLRHEAHWVAWVFHAAQAPRQVELSSPTMPTLSGLIWRTMLSRIYASLPICAAARHRRAGHPRLLAATAARCIR